MKDNFFTHIEKGMVIIMYKVNEQVSGQKKVKKSAAMDVRVMVGASVLAAISVILMLFDIPLGFLPPFYKIDFSEVPVLIGAFTFGPMAGILIELAKILLNLVINGTDTAFIGEIANFIIGCSLVVPAAWIYKQRKTKKNAVVGLVLGTIIMTMIGCLINAYLLLPAYAKAFQMPIEALIEIGAKVNGNITDLFTFVALGVAPFNLIKGAAVSFIVILLYKKISVILKG